jgi:hypothetical protein
MGAPEPLPNASSDITEWLPLLGSIVQALCGGRENEPPDAPRGGGETAPRSDEEIR